MNEEEPYFVISVVSKMLKIHPQTIRHYERLGFLNPHRTEGNMRLFSRKDVERLEQICSFTNVGVNLAGVEIIVKLLEKMDSIREQMESEITNLRQEQENLMKRLKSPDEPDEL